VYSFAVRTEISVTNLSVIVIYGILQAQFKSCFVGASVEEKKLPTGVIMPPMSQQRSGETQKPIYMQPASAKRAEDQAQAENSSKKKKRSRWD
jgi:hypothetical protein